MDQQQVIEAICDTLAETFKFLAPPIIISIFLPTLLNKPKLKYLSKAEGNIISTKLPAPKETVEEKELDDKTKQFLKPFVEKLVLFTNEKNLKTLNRNLKTLTIKQLPLLLGLISAGDYDTKKNIIRILSKRSFGHELLHLASSYYDEETKIAYSGFRQTKDNISIGTGLDEGYTELLASRIYNKKNKVTAYHKEAKLARLFEFFFDDPKEMEDYFFNYNLPGFIHHLEKFASRNEILKIIYDMDSVEDNKIKYITTQVKLYNIFERSNPAPEKLQEFKNLILETPMAAMIIAGEKFKLNYCSQKQNHEQRTK